jgi:coatomer protein complex subunit epsilon
LIPCQYPRHTQTNLHAKGGEKYQAAYYVFEELAQSTSTQATTTLLAQAIAELHLGRLPEAESAFEQALALDSKNADVLANQIVLNTVLGKDTTEAKKGLAAADKNHVSLVDWSEKKDEFAKACAKYNPKFEV